MPVLLLSLIEEFLDTSDDFSAFKFHNLVKMEGDESSSNCLFYRSRPQDLL
jgi:hypothetical protein